MPSETIDEPLFKDGEKESDGEPNDSIGTRLGDPDAVPLSRDVRLLMRAQLEEQRMRSRDAED